MVCIIWRWRGTAEWRAGCFSGPCTNLYNKMFFTSSQKVLVCTRRNLYLVCFYLFLFIYNKALQTRPISETMYRPRGKNVIHRLLLDEWKTFGFEWRKGIKMKNYRRMHVLTYLICCQIPCMETTTVHSHEVYSKMWHSLWNNSINRNAVTVAVQCLYR